MHIHSDVIEFMRIGEITFLYFAYALNEVSVLGIYAEEVCKVFFLTNRFPASLPFLLLRLSLGICTFYFSCFIF